MCDEESNGVGEIVPNETTIYRACTKSRFLSEDKEFVEPLAFYKDGKNHKDGLSVAFSLLDAVKNFPRNHGAIRTTVAEIHGLERGLEVRFDTTDPTHALIRKLPCLDRDPEEKELALAVASELAGVADVESKVRVPVAIVKKD
jgi:hypothetical protein